MHGDAECGTSSSPDQSDGSDAKTLVVPNLKSKTSRIAHVDLVAEQTFIWELPFVDSSHHPATTSSVVRTAGFHE